MLPANQKKFLYLLLLLCCIPLFFLNIHETHTAGGDDYALYIKEAKNISEGKPYYQTNYVFNEHNNSYSPPQYPPGFPLLLAPVIKIFGIAIKPICYFNTVIAVLLLFGFFEFFRKYTGMIAAACLAVLISYSGILIDLKQFALSDQTNLLFVLLYLIARNAKNFSWYRIVLLILFATMAMLIRTQSILLLAAEGAWFVLAMIREWKQQRAFPIKTMLKEPSVYIIAGCMGLNLLLNNVVFYCPQSAPGFYAQFLEATLQKGIVTVVRDNINFFLEAIQSFFHYNTENSIRTAMVTIMKSSGLILCLTGLVLSASRRLSFDDVFFVFSCGLMLYYPIHDARYFLPAIAIVYFYCYTSLEKILPAVTKVRLRYVGFAITLFCLTAGFKYLYGTTGPVYGYVPEAKDRQAFSYISQHVHDTDIILCARPRLITLYTDKKCMIFAWQHSMEENRRITDSMQVKYVLNMSGLAEDYIHTLLNQHLHPTDSTRIAEGYMLYKLR